MKQEVAGKIKVPIVSLRFSLMWFFKCRDLSINQINTSKMHGEQLLKAMHAGLPIFAAKLQTSGKGVTNFL